MNICSVCRKELTPIKTFGPVIDPLCWSCYQLYIEVPAWWIEVERELFDELAKLCVD